MLKTTMIWDTDAGGTEEVSSGSGAANSIQSVSITECVNSGKELTLGSVCAGMIEAKILAPAGGLELHAGNEMTVYRQDGAKNRLVGCYIMEKPTRPSANTVKIVGYDFVTKLDKDLAAWLNGLTGWPYKLLDLAGMVCAVCGLSLVNTQIPNGDFLVQKFTRDSVTGRQLMQWIGELCCRFCRVSRTNPAQLEFAWYETSGKSIKPYGDLYFFQNSLTYEDYAIAPVDAVQMRLSESEGGAVWPVVPETYNRYVITGNPLLSGSLQADIEPALNNILTELDGFSYTPCKVSVPAGMDLRAGHTVTVTDKNGKSFTACIMTKVQAGQKDTLEGTGSYRRDTATANSAQSASASAATAAAAASASATAAANAAQKTVDSLTQKAVFDKLTNNGNAKGIYLLDGDLYINASYLSAGVLSSKDGKTFYLDLDNGILNMNATSLNISGKTVGEIADNSAKAAIDAQTQEQVFAKLTNNGTIQGIYVQDGKWYINAELAQIVNLIAEHVKSTSGNATMELDAASLSLLVDSITNMRLSNAGGSPTLYMYESSSGNPGAGYQAVFSPSYFSMGKDFIFDISFDENGASVLRCSSISPDGFGNCKWEYISSLGKTVLVQQ